MHIESLKDQQKSSFYIAKFENAVDDEKKIEATWSNAILFYKTGHLATNVKQPRTFKVCN